MTQRYRALKNGLDVIEELTDDEALKRSDDGWSMYIDFLGHWFPISRRRAL